MATPKSTKERMLRPFRLRKVEPKHRSMVGRTVPRKPANNDPHRSGNFKLHNEAINLSEGVAKAMIFMGDNYGKGKPELKMALDGFEFVQILKNIADHMTAVRLGGWKMVDGRFVNESGRTASPKYWNLKEGRLVTKLSKKPLEYEIDWLLTLSECCE